MSSINKCSLLLHGFSIVLLCFSWNVLAKPYRSTSSQITIGGQVPNITRKCLKADQHKCPNGICIPQVWVCDQDNDCGDNTDEDPDMCLDEKRKCREEEDFLCYSGRCLPKHWRCDGDKDCADGDDEDPFMCRGPNMICKPAEYRCPNDGLCIDMHLKCDGDNDCFDGSDEDPVMCADRKKECAVDEFKCPNGDCIIERWKCDGDNDCSDGADELPAMCPRLNRLLQEKARLWLKRMYKGKFAETDFIVEGSEKVEDIATHSNEEQTS
ncbi:very low-density lipoprotein receptor isoform X2 [Anabrus simplex]|uniref:very low-density lipoprotein receptor isoform X2 n=1 Tax=Anabrus simplex TaxID=316456 RepID=UPI0035A2F065